MSEYDKELKPCPFCGGIAYVERSTFHDAKWFIVCMTCKASSGWSDLPAEAVERWNGRILPGIDLILEERVRQIKNEGYHPHNDRRHEDGFLSAAAAAYALNKIPGITKRYLYNNGYDGIPWLWDPQFDKRHKHDRKRSLVIAGALIAAELDRFIMSEAEASFDENNQDATDDDVDCNRPTPGFMSLDELDEYEGESNE